MRRIVTAVLVWLLMGHVSLAEDRETTFQATLTKAKQGDAEAQHNMGVIYYRGVGVPRNYRQAFDWYCKAAKQGNAEAQYNLAVMYNEGHGVSRDKIQAYAWMTLSEAQGFQIPKINLRVLEQVMTTDQINEAQEQSRVWFESGARCDSG